MTYWDSAKHTADDIASHEESIARLRERMEETQRSIEQHYGVLEGLRKHLKRAHAGERLVEDAGGIPESDVLSLYHDHGCLLGLAWGGRELGDVAHCHRCGTVERVEFGWMRVTT